MKTLDRIMLVDDDSNTNLFNRIILEKASAANEIVEFQNGHDALSYLDTGKNYVDLILLDINMPVMNGWQFLDEYQKLDENKKASIVVIMLTSSVNNDDRKRAEQLGFIREFINKPLNSETVEQIRAMFE